MTTTPPLPRASDQAAERALFEAAEIAYWQSQQPAHADPLTDKEKAYLLRPNTWDKTSYEACDGRWQGWQWRAAIAHSAAHAPEASPLTAQQLEPLLKHWFGLDKCDGLFNTERLLAFANAVRAAQGAGTTPTYWNSQRKMIERAIIGLRDGWATRKDADDALAMLATHPAPVSTAPSKSPEFEGIGDAPVSTAAATTASASEPPKMSIDEAREYLVKFMEQHFTDKTFHRYIRADRVDRNRLAGDFAWQMASALRMLDSRAPSRAADGQQGASRAVLEDLETFPSPHGTLVRLADAKCRFAAIARAPLPAQAGVVDLVVEANRQLLLDRSRVGIVKYGAPLGEAGLKRKQLIQHALEEALDLANYLQADLQRDDAQSRAQSDTTGGSDA